MALNDDEPLQPLDEILNSTSQSSSSGTTGLSSYNITNGYNDLDMEDSRDETRPGCGVDQGVDLVLTPQALHPVGGGLPRTGRRVHILGSQCMGVSAWGSGTWHGTIRANRRGSRV